MKPDIIGPCYFPSMYNSYQFHDFMYCAWQAYTNELENKVSHLEEENERLKKQKVLLSPVILILFSFSCLFAEGLHV